MHRLVTASGEDLPVLDRVIAQICIGELHFTVDLYTFTR